MNQEDTTDQPGPVKRGGVCSMFGEECCTVAPVHISPDGDLTKTLTELKAYSEILRSQSGTDNPIDE